MLNSALSLCCLLWCRSNHQHPHHHPSTTTSLCTWVPWKRQSYECLSHINESIDKLLYKCFVQAVYNCFRIFYHLFKSSGKLLPPWNLSVTFENKLKLVAAKVVHMNTCVTCGHSVGKMCVRVRGLSKHPDAWPILTCIFISGVFSTVNWAK